MNRQRGIALITAILVMALATIAATAILTSSNIAIHRAANLQDSERSWWYADGVESWVKSVLERDLEDNKLDTLKDVWAKPVDYLPVDEGYVKGGIVDLQGRFNLNNFATQSAANLKADTEYFTRLLAAVDPEIDSYRAKAIIDAIRDWVDGDSEPTGMDGAEDTDYLGLTPSYRPANHNMASVSELLAVKGITRELYLKLTQCAVVNNLPQGCIAALPQTDTAINVNTAPEPVLRALTVQPGPELEAFIRDRVEHPAESREEFNGKVLHGGDSPKELIDVRSNFFMLRGEAFIGSGHLSMYSFYYRGSSGRPAVYGRSTDGE